MICVNKVVDGEIILAVEPDKRELRKRCDDAAFISRIKYGGDLRRDPEKPNQKEKLYVELTIDE